ncbi:hypothetical protein [Lentilactobacillus buchneri]|uniref:Uncharacterized protein n=2 Tax=Lentilactobacillus buchneri TaxID=1581 RepID=J9W3X2_LENBU|nr:hypothetical protein [Lentilactobacillus buchneri]MCC6101499.1 hypothetical protein [Lactobacillus sp.]WCJ51086.1 hypothetical protein OKF32_07240 [Lentilactobacillus sp. Egmn17]AEB74345.1 hypothetical protein Lbuc_2102 [Lentilactobacillus buchneri NRRL B-30929]AFS01178.1 hypothetical protein LBUCD034_2201 [Lentilactobacillus buchneri subsp. silagei CD034]KRK69355.1 hypothetical protein FC79_GL001733 [Lentilactobacillus buchneri DSM 20057]
MTTILYVLSGITDLLIIAFIFMAMYEFARKDQTKPNHHFGIWAIVCVFITFGLLMLT